MVLVMAVHPVQTPCVGTFAALNVVGLTPITCSYCPCVTSCVLNKKRFGERDQGSILRLALLNTLNNLHRALITDPQVMRSQFPSTYQFRNCADHHEPLRAGFCAQKSNAAQIACCRIRSN